VVAVSKVDDNVSYTELQIDDICRLIEVMVVMLIIDGDVDVERENKEQNIINASNRQKRRLYIESEILPHRRQHLQ